MMNDRTNEMRRTPFLLAAIFLILFAGSPSLFAQQPPQEVSPPATPSSAAPLPSIEAPHRFWDRENDWLFVGVGASRALDYSSTLNMRRRGRQEILLSNWVVDHHGLFAGIEVAGTAVSIGASYWLHRTGHHSLERWASIVHIGVTTVGAVRNYSLETAH